MRPVLTVTGATAQGKDWGEPVSGRIPEARPGRGRPAARRGSAMKKIMVIYETAGGGHQAAAKAIEGALAAMYPGQFEVQLMPVRIATGSQRVSHLMDV